MHNNTMLELAHFLCHTLNMKVSLIAAVTADGFIGKDAAHTSLSWTSSEDKQWFSRHTKEAGCIIMGARTFQTIGRGLPGRTTLVYTNHPQTITGIDGVEPVHGDPAALLTQLESKGVSTVVICGGTSIYTLFMKAGLLDDIYLTVEPLFFGTGTPLFDTGLDTKLALVESGPLNPATNPHTICMHYSVVR